jgi:spore maturation protein A
MLNKVWFWLLLVGILYGFGKGAWESASIEADATAPVAENSAAEKPSAEADAAAAEPEVGLTAMGKKLNAAVLESANVSVELCIGLIGIMAVWLGLLNVAKDAGLVDAFAKLLRPLMRWLFPEVPDGHPAQGAMLMNLSANMLGLDNAATPMGLKAMRELQELNPVKDTATNSMAMFMAVNTSSITLIPFTIIGYRALNGSENPAEPIAGTLLATLVSSFIAVFITRWLAKLPRFQVAAETAGGAAAGELPPDGGLA